ncbi:MAG: hypothetical protein M1839_001652 [Geoglossum umbratile]|nr:MAG: hypothetical protein M1839_001652 [Geoglossum umbratile]
MSKNPIDTGSTDTTTKNPGPASQCPKTGQQSKLQLRRQTDRLSQMDDNPEDTRTNQDIEGGEGHSDAHPNAYVPPVPEHCTLPDVDGPENRTLSLLYSLRS